MENASPHFIKGKPLRLLWAGLAAVLVMTAMAPVDLDAQIILAGVIVPAMLLARRAATERADNMPRAFVLMMSCFITLRYLSWRLFFTLNSDGPVSETVTIVLFLAELYAAFLHFTGIFVNFSPIKREDRHLDMTQAVPSVDVLVPSFNEPVELLEVTLRACKMLRYPQARLQIYLLDDGGTDEKCAKSPAGRARRAEMQALCAHLNIGYLTRARNERAKAGNINAALRHTHGEIVLMLDADHVPAVDFLERTIPWFIDDDKVFLVQTPHFMINPDPIDRNLLNAFQRMPSENEMFYLTIQNGLDFWESSFFCGSAALLRRKHLELIGGLSGMSITEDCETALDLHAHGLKSVYVSHAMVAGLAPESFKGYVIQRMRWAQGMTQILLLKNPLRKKGLRWFQKLCYLRNCMFWLFPFARLVFTVAPLAYLFFGLHIYNATLPEIAAYGVPHIIASLTVTNLLYRRTRWPLISELYEVMQSIYSFPALIQVMLHPRRPKFSVTPKNEMIDQDFISPLARPFHILLAITVLAFGAGMWRLAAFPESRALTGVVLFWNLFNCLLLLAAFGALMERRQRRSSTRVPVLLDGVLGFENGERIACRIDNLSVGGAQLVATDGARALAPGMTATLEALIVPMKRHAHLHIVLRSSFRQRDKTVWGVQFNPQSEDERNDIVALMYADSGKWEHLIARRTRPMPFFKALKVIFLLVGRALLHREPAPPKAATPARKPFSRKPQPATVYV